MTVRELIEKLLKFDPDHLVVQAKDAGGNNFSPLADAQPDYYDAITNWYGDVYFAEEDKPDGAVPAIVLWPTV